MKATELIEALLRHDLDDQVYLEVALIAISGEDQAGGARSGFD